jgi:hypothetical protein
VGAVTNAVTVRCLTDAVNKVVRVQWAQLITSG